MYEYFCDIVAVLTLLVALSIYDLTMFHIYFKYFYKGNLNEKIK